MNVRVVVAGAVAGLLSLGVGVALAGDKVQATLVSPVGCTSSACPGLVHAGEGVSSAFVNGTSGASVQTKSNCQMQIKVKKLTGLSDGARVICVSSGLTSLGGTPFNSGTVVTGTLAAGAMKVKVDMTPAGCQPDKGGALDIASFGGNTCCYEDDAGYNAATSCAGALAFTGGWICPASTPALPDSDVIACQGIHFKPAN
ncbi:MAG: hypothetical protein U0807_08545 [Candidatus Binatia bacterium]